MKTLYLSIIFIIYSMNLWAQTNVTGNQSGTWTLANSPYQVTGTITVPNGQILTIEAGVEINFQGYYQIIVDGKLLVNGTESNPVLFTTNTPSTGWGGIRFDTNSQISVFHYCTMQYGKTSATASYPNNHGGAVLLKESNAEFYNCQFLNNDATGDDDGMGGAVYGINRGTASQTLTKFIDCTFKNNHAYGEGGAIKFTNDGSTELTRCIFENNSSNYGGGAIFFYSAVNVHLTNCLFFNNYTANSGGGAIKGLNPNVTLFITNCTFYNNTAAGAGEGGAMSLDYTDATIINSIIYGNHQTYGDEINIGMNASATINYCDVNMPSSASGGNNLANVDPLFVNAANGDFHLQASSPCIDTGIDVSLPYNGTAPDIGCYEYGASNINQNNPIVFAIYPNPVQSIINLNTIKNIKNVRISDLQGRKVFEKNYSRNNSLKVDLSNLKSGIYNISIQDVEGKTGTQKIIKL